MNKTYIERQIRLGKWIPTILPNGLKVYLSERKSNFIEQFDSRGDNFCPSFKVLGVASGTCAVRCKGCYLLGTYRVLREPGKPILYTNLDKCAEELEKDIIFSEEPYIYNDGEKGDSLIYDKYHGGTKVLLPVFIKYRRSGNKFLRLTKSANVKHLIGLEHHGVMILSYSLNPQEVANIFETFSQASIEKRIKAASFAQSKGDYPSRVRIDPIIPIKNWKKIYEEFLERMAKLKFRPKRFTLGTYRVLKRSKHIYKIFNTEFAFPISKLEDKDQSRIQVRLRIPLEERVEIYSFIIEQIQRIFPKSTISLCKETKELRKRIGFTDKDTFCNCTL